MFIAMNRFHVVKGHEADFEHVFDVRQVVRGGAVRTEAPLAAQ
jgi:hypothetical protein